jgi:hypothetical protein
MLFQTGKNAVIVPGQAREGTDTNADRIEIAQRAELKPIGEIARDWAYQREYLIPYGHTKAKVDLEFFPGCQIDLTGN